MKIVNRATFLILPVGTVFAKYRPQIFDEIQIKDKTWTNDYLYRSLLDPADPSGETFVLLDEAEANGTSFSLDFDSTRRDGLYDEDQLFAIYEPDDLRGLINALSECLTLANKPNDPAKPDR